MASDQSLTGLFSSHHGTKFFKQNTLIFSFFLLKNPSKYNTNAEKLFINSKTPFKNKNQSIHK
jgi:hypothetical protein